MSSLMPFIFSLTSNMLGHGQTAMATWMRRVLRRDGHHLAAAPGDRAHIAIGLIVLVDDELLRRVELGDGVGNFEIEQIGGALEALGMFGRFEDLAAIGAFALEYAGGVMQPVREDVQLRVRPRRRACRSSR